MLNKPVARDLDCSLHISELELRVKGPELLVRRRLSVLAIRVGRVVDHLLQGVVHRHSDHSRRVANGDLVLLVDAEDEGVDVLVVEESPDDEGAEIHAESELPEGLPRPEDGERSPVTLGDEALVNKSGDNVSRLEVIVVVRAENVSGDKAGEVAAVLLVVAPVENVDHTLGIGVTLVAVVGRAVVNHGLIDGIGGLVGEDAGREEGDELLDLVDAAALHDVVVDENVLAIELDLVLEVGEEPANTSGEMDNVSGLVLLEHLVSLRLLPEVVVLVPKEDPLGAVLGLGVLLQVGLDTVPDKAGSAGDENKFLLLFAHFFIADSNRVVTDF